MEARDDLESPSDLYLEAVTSTGVVPQFPLCSWEPGPGALRSVLTHGFVVEALAKQCTIGRDVIAPRT